MKQPGGARSNVGEEQRTEKPISQVHISLLENYSRNITNGFVCMLKTSNSATSDAKRQIRSKILFCIEMNADFLRRIVFFDPSFSDSGRVYQHDVRILGSLNAPLDYSLWKAQRTVQLIWRSFVYLNVYNLTSSFSTTEQHLMVTVLVTILIYGTFLMMLMFIKCNKRFINELFELL